MNEQVFPFPALARTPVDGLICQECQRDCEPKDLELRNDRGMPLSLCQGCRTALDERRALEKAAAEEERAFHHDVVRALNRDASVPTITEIVAMLIDKFGGRQAFVDQVYIQLSAQFTDKARKGSPAVMQTCKMLLNIVLASTAYQSSLPAAAVLTDEQVESELEKMLQKLKTKKRDAISSDDG